MCGVCGVQHLRLAMIFVHIYMPMSPAAYATRIVSLHTCHCVYYTRTLPQTSYSHSYTHLLIAHPNATPAPPRPRPVRHLMNIGISLREILLFSASYRHVFHFPTLVLPPTLSFRSSPLPWTPAADHTRMHRIGAEGAHVFAAALIW